jgi:hypothetical protein
VASDSTFNCSNIDGLSNFSHHNQKISLCAVHSEKKKKKRFQPVSGSHLYNPSYSGGRDQEDLSSKPAQAKSARPYLEKIHHKKIGAG